MSISYAKRKMQRAVGRFSSDAHGFTSVELLVVIGIVLLITSLAIPAILHAHQSAMRTTCTNNARQLSAAWTLYSGDNQDRLVVNVDGKAGGLTNWVAGNMTVPGFERNSLILVDPRYSLMAGYLRTASIYKCTADDSRLARSVSMNCRLNPTRLYEPPRWVSGMKFKTFHALSEIGRTSDIFVTIEESQSSINDGFFAVDMSNTGDPYGKGESRPYYLIDRPGMNHSGSAILSFADMHVESHRWTEKTTFAEPRSDWYTSSGDRDAFWLQSHCTYE